MRRVMFAVLLLTLTACANSPIVLVKCTPVAEYSHEFQIQVADAKAALPKDSVLHRVLDDFRQMRQRSRACDDKL